MLGIAWLVLNPSPATPTSAVERLSAALTAVGLPGWLVGTDQVEFGLNVALFVPLAALTSLLWPQRRVWFWVLVGFALSSTLEWLQLTFLSDRSSTSRDIVANTLGALVGAVVVVVGRALIREHRGRVVARPR
ncbi:VanZ family protein [Nocardioides sp. HDW12B]|uniref:VanZ family protein n=1 Tax=Nocardioides sp. HDW12B TaxID=2714939 RepID=UPI00140A130D|nr:VanZ family protein [Nocardioides sp. HDW12B]QIK64947.1 VanZ family protein [Nocardioides sp. HDW12B]